MECQSLFSGKNKKNISECRLLKFLPSMLSINIGTGFRQNIIMKKCCEVVG